MRQDKKAKYLNKSYNFTPTTVKASSICIHDSFIEEGSMPPLLTPAMGQARKDQKSAH